MTQKYLCEDCGVVDGAPHKLGCIGAKRLDEAPAPRDHLRAGKPGGSTPGQYALEVKTVHNATQLVECGEVIDALKLNFNMGESFKALWRFDKKETPEYNLNKMIWFVRREQFERGFITAEEFIAGTK